ncbi:TlpA family protein disulfide reductase [Motilibacter aurantiacus]|uniref:TlpA family protein disulfide reductase n=1 Tax=Motilibacter aurantiacus TaxID=2714955 RepID=UPI00140DC0BE|nr:TlpA disulfide reductase family protein [Motilibacter aurantiacus]NHC44164.1 TlpA family protein disulfide reductase [Motilibacter aurantiacus]
MSRVRAAAAAVLLLTVAGCSGGGEDDGVSIGVDRVQSWQDVSERRELPALAGRTRDGEPLDLAALKGSVVVLNVWGSWCGPCKVEAPALAKVSNELMPQGVQFVGLDLEGSYGGGRAAAEAFEKQYGLTYPSIYDTDGSVLVKLRGLVPQSPPSTLVIDPEGRIAGRVSGTLEDESILRGLIADAGGPAESSWTPEPAATGSPG